MRILVLVIRVIFVSVASMRITVLSSGKNSNVNPDFSDIMEALCIGIVVVTGLDIGSIEGTGDSEVTAYSLEDVDGF